MLNEKLSKYDIVLASASPRRKYLLEQMGLDFEVIVKDVQEIYPSAYSPMEVAAHLSELKASVFFSDELLPNKLLITADTVVAINDEILGKPNSRDEAFEMLEKLSANEHEVITGVCLRTIEKLYSFTVGTRVFFKKLSNEEIDYYITNFLPFDKAGAYGIQEWIGHAAIERIDGSYFNVMGLPTHQLYEELLKFTEKFDK